MDESILKRPVGYTADELNDHLQNGGVIQMSTYTRSTIYKSKHAGWFSEDSNGCLMVKSGRNRVCLSLINNGALIVGLKKGRYVTKN